MSLSYALKTILGAALCVYILILSQNIASASAEQRSTWGGLYDMDELLRERHPFSAQPTLTTERKSTAGKARSIVANAQPANKDPSSIVLEPYSEPTPTNPFSEIRAGGLLHDTGPFSDSDESGIDSNFEILFTSPKILSALWAPRPHLGISYNSVGDTNQVYLGMTWNWPFWRNWFVDLSLGAMAHDGHLVGVDGESKSLGCRALFRESLNIGYRFKARHGLMLHFDHSSNASLCKKNTSDGTAHGRHTVVLNEGLENIGIRYGYMF